jgi:hypothetical protein
MPEELILTYRLEERIPLEASGPPPPTSRVDGLRPLDCPADPSWRDGRWLSSVTRVGWPTDPPPPAGGLPTLLSRRFGMAGASFHMLAAAATFGTCYGGSWREILLQRRRCSRHWLRIALADPSVTTLIGTVGAIFVGGPGHLHHLARQPVAVRHPNSAFPPRGKETRCTSLAFWLRLWSPRVCC